uniref:Serum/glucocorticoid regulated kinase 1 n=1 Tax=Petromyzon marinus TaxID=7757 RepID=S4RXN2_PETMA
PRRAKPTDFDFLKIIGKGSFGKVLLAKLKTDEKFYAVKVLQKKAILKKKEQKHIMAERNVLLKNVKHPFLVGLHYSFQTADKLYFVLDYINGGEVRTSTCAPCIVVHHKWKGYREEPIDELNSLHFVNQISRDLKPENILLDFEGHIILTDFGLCKEGIQPNDTTSTFCGTPEESDLTNRKEIRSQRSSRTRGWDLRCAWRAGQVTTHRPSVSEVSFVPSFSQSRRFKPNISNSARDLLEGLLHKDRTQRLGASGDFTEIKGHVFFSPINWEDLLSKKIVPPFNPNVNGPSDLRHFDPEFISEPVPGSVCRSPGEFAVSASFQEARDAFAGFSYAPPNGSAFL